MEHIIKEEIAIIAANLIYKLLDDERKIAELIEHYEYCQTLKDTMKIISDYTLGYRPWDQDVQDVLYYSAIKYGDLVASTKYNETFAIDGMYFEFNIKRK